MMKKTIFLFLSVFMLSGCQQKTQINDLNTPKVKLSAVKSITSSTNFHYSGTIEPFQTIPLTFQAMGTVQQILVDEGDAVRKGQLLATVDKSDVQNMYNISLYKYEQAKDAYNRLKEVHDNGSLTEIKWVEMETTLQQAKASVDIAKNSLDKCNLRSPDNGIIGRRNVEPGMSSLGSNIAAPLTLIKIEKVYVEISVPENEIGKIKKGLSANFNVAALDDELFAGIVTNVGVMADPISRTYQVKILVKNPELKLKPGMVCDVTLDITANKEILLVSYQSVDKDNDNNTFVFVVDPVEKIAKKRIVHIGDYHQDNIEILSGLVVGEMVVCEGKEKLSDKCKISL